MKMWILSAHRQVWIFLTAGEALAWVHSQEIISFHLQSVTSSKRKRFVH